MKAREAGDRGGGRPHRALSPVLRISLLLGVAVHLAGFLVFRIKSGPLPDTDAGPPFLRFVSDEEAEKGSGLRESAELLDSAPLFVPTRWNTAHDAGRPRGGDARFEFSDFEPAIDLAAELRPAGPEVATPHRIEGADDLLDLGAGRVFESFGRAPSEVPALAEPSPFALVEVLDAPPSERVPREVRIPVGTLPARGALPPEPAAFLLRVEGDGRTPGRAVLSDGSGDPEFDAAARSWLERPETTGRLPTGYLSVRVFP